MGPRDMSVGVPPLGRDPNLPAATVITGVDVRDVLTVEFDRVFRITHWRLPDGWVPRGGPEAPWAEYATDFHNADLTDVLAWLSQQPAGHPADVWQIDVLIGPVGARKAIPLSGYDPYSRLGHPS